ncbi:MAG TPA: 6-phosphogluconolactonase [Thermoanaerobaculia bacterium]|nr:6-phosphogluconolactonase [Thermoanaerobaculia bacterium]
MEELSRARPGAGAAEPELRVAANAEELMRLAADVFVASLSAAAAAAAPGGPRSRRASVALAGGSTPRGLYRLLAAPGEPYRGCLLWEHIHFFWGDERHVPPDHPDSNFRMARETMLDPAAVPPGNVHRIPAEEPDAGSAAARYEAELVRFFALAPGERPRFDLVLLGLGEEGHTASLFPGSPVLDERTRLAAAPWVEAHREFRITLTPPAINGAALVAFLVSGEAKAAALAAVLEGELRPERYPAQIVRPDSGKLLWLVDRAAASGLSASAAR